MRRIKGDPMVAFWHLKETTKKDGEKPFTWADRDMTRENSFKLKKERFRLDVRKELLTVRLIRCWIRLPREVGIPGSILDQAGWL